MSDIERRLRALDGMQVEDPREATASRERVARRPSLSEPNPTRSRTHRLPTIIAAFAIFFAVLAIFLPRIDHDASQPIGPAPRDPGTLSVTCTDQGVQVAPETVQMNPRGVHVEVDNRSGQMEILYMRDPEQIGTSAGTGPFDSRASWDLKLAPGTWVVGCFSVPFSTYRHPLSDYSQPIEIVDPYGYWPKIRACYGPLRSPPGPGIHGLENQRARRARRCQNVLEP